MQNIVIFGGTGFLAESLIPRLKGNILIVARNEGNLIKTKQKFPNVEIMTGDIADRWTVKKAMKGADEIYLLAAIKGVDTAEKDTMQCAKTNVNGVINILSESFITKPKVLVFISTDKAAQVKGMYGASKLLGEGLMREAHSINKDTKYRVVRYGNVLWSTFSILPKWKYLIENNKPIQITDPSMSRFFWNVEQAVDLIFDAIKKQKDATPYIPTMKAMSIGNIAEAMMQKFGRVPVEIIGNRGGENQNETMDGKIFSNEVEQFSIEEIKEII